MSGGGEVDENGCWFYELDVWQRAEVFSPGFHLNRYPDDVAICYRVICPTSPYVRVGVEFDDVSVEPFFDALELRDTSAGGQLVAVITSASLWRGARYFSIGNEMRVDFRSDSDVNQGRFRFRFLVNSFEDAGMPSVTRHLVADDDEEQFLTFKPRVGENDVSWLITTPTPRAHIRLTVLRFRPDDEQFPVDFLDVHDGGDESAALMTHMSAYGNRKPMTYVSTSSRVLIHHRANNVTWPIMSYEAGFELVYRRTAHNAQACHVGSGLHLLDDVTLRVRAPDRASCLWVVKSQRAEVVSVRATVNVEVRLGNVTTRLPSNEWMAFDASRLIITYDGGSSASGGGLVECMAGDMSRSGASETKRSLFQLLASAFVLILTFDM